MLDPPTDMGNARMRDHVVKLMMKVGLTSLGHRYPLK